VVVVILIPRSGKRFCALFPKLEIKSPRPLSLRITTVIGCFMPNRLHSYKETKNDPHEQVTFVIDHVRECHDFTGDRLVPGGIVEHDTGNRAGRNRWRGP
jgi:hypothetical protein